jgi:hypothetical protein
VKRTRAMLTVDWDFFVPLDPLIHDFGHVENLLFLNWVWGTRTRWIEDIVTSGEERAFWRQIQKRNDIRTNKVVVSDSHIHGYDVGNAGQHITDTIVIVDAHHDTWPYKTDDDQINYDCGSWLRLWLDSAPNRRAIWIPPDHVKEHYDKEMVEPAVRKKITVLGSLDDLEGYRFETVHICRSGCWTPPWLDHRFKSFVERGKFEFIETLGAEEWNPMKARWSRPEIKRAREEDPASIASAADYRAQIEAVRRMRALAEERSTG